MDTAYVCHTCASRLEDKLRQAAEAWAELDITITRQDRMAEPGPHTRGHAPAAPIRPDGGALRHYADQDTGWPAGLPVDLGASEAADAIRNTVTTWARHIEAERGQRPPTEPADLMRWVAGQLHWLRYRAEAGEALDELGDAARLLWRTIDRPAQRVDAGQCWAPTPAGPCQRRLTALPGAAHIRCPECGAEHDARQRREALLVAARDIRGTAVEVARWLSALDVPTTAAAVRGLAHRARVLADGYGRYRLGDVERVRREQIERVAA